MGFIAHGEVVGQLTIGEAGFGATNATREVAGTE